MIPELAHFALVLALAVALVQSGAAWANATPGAGGWLALARPAARAQFVLVAIAYAGLTQSFVANDFSVLYVARHSNSMLPLVYRITAVWGGHEGSILLWTLILAGWTLALSVFSRGLDVLIVSRTLGVIGLVSSGFLLFTLFTSNPFERLLPAAAEGQDLTPLLQDPGMVIHPPMLYMGYVGFVVAFAFAVTALLTGRLDTAWARASRPWTTAAWCFLTCGIALGSFWAYYELGWGGWWFWDPVENASLMPWLAGTALIHSLAVTHKRGAFRAWTALLAIVTFSLSLLGTFLVRSGVLSSVHAFAADPRRGVFILCFLALVTGGSLALFAWRAPQAGRGASFEAVSRESMLLANNVLLLVSCAAVMLGTLYPLIIDALGLGKLSVGPPYFEAVFVPLMAPALFLMGVGPMARWRHARTIDLARRLRWALCVSVASAVVVPLALGRWTPMVAFGLLLAAWIAGTCVLNLLHRLRSHPASRWTARVAAQSASYYGMLLAHFGVAVFIVGVTIVGGYSVERDVRMAPGDILTLGRYRIRFEGVHERKGPNYMAARGTLAVQRDGQPLTVLLPERRLYLATRTPMTETAIDRRFTRDLYATLGEPLGPVAWSVRVYYKPFVGWIWGGCLMMALGGLLSIRDRVRRAPVRRSVAETDTAVAPQQQTAPAMTREVPQP
ncbi:heme lyase CcmF/NrfE family subunit [Variovorax sp. GT1P44]|uniref:heme lyase CcmF/NrfE family subunit n=1 Tax=Variovorax sp. GT1P44 TaxID=3443742 RepID=UPI003F48814D